LAIYHFFLLDASGQVKAREQHDCLDDTDAINTARVQAAGRVVEIWSGALKIAVVKPDGTVEGPARR
jgi:hypothetical protein